MELKYDFEIEDIDFTKSNGLVPCIVQDPVTRRVLMMAYMNKAALQRSLETGFATFFSRSKQRLWKKGEESGNVLRIKELKLDCDNDTLLVCAEPTGPVCHTGSDTCWNERNERPILEELEKVILERAADGDASSYTNSLLRGPINKIAQKVGEEGVEVALAGVNEKEDQLISECADLLYHMLVLLKARDLSLNDVYSELEARRS